ncbi:MAG: tryptophan synthase subunit alpha [Streptosporangiaceae bacterium]
MANRIDERLAVLAAGRRKGLMTHVVVGYPSLASTSPLIVAMDEAGADFIELQIPFSDPLADGPTIQSACEAAITRGARVRDAFSIAAESAGRVAAPLLFMAYANTVYRYGPEPFCRDAAAAGISGLIVPDLPAEAARHEGYLDACRRHGLHNIVTLAPTSTGDRMAVNASVASGFVYCMSRQGVTGAQLGLAPDVPAYLRRAREHLTVPMAVGFGISDRARLEQVLPYCDIATVGSALIDRLAGTEPGDLARQADTTRTFLRTLTPALA